jgi:hypothetical protein|tara:strand:+ start:340 stop:546 length:207 start_codon:yes stop_codon:yes gene_type:complete
VRQIVDRQHVGTPNREVIAAVVRGLKDGWRTWRTLDRRTRRKWMNDAIRIHASNRELYTNVMRYGRGV